MATTKKKAAKKAAKPAPKKAAPKKAAPKKAAKPAAVAAPRPMTANVYLSYPGTCEQAFKHYKSVFGGEFAFVGRYKDMPPMGDMPLPAAAKNKLMHISLPLSKDCILMGCDILEGMGHTLNVGNNISISVSAPSRTEAERIYKGLAKGGNAHMPLADQFWGAYFGMLVDKFGIHWMVSFDQAPMK